MKSAVCFLWISLAVFVGAHLGLAQTGETPDTSGIVGSTGTPYAMATVPAQTILSSTSEVVRPATVQELEATIGGFVDPATGAFSVPDSYAVEFSPLLVFFGNTVTLPDYRRIPWLYRTSISMAGSTTGTSGSHVVAAGIRTLLVDGSDFRMNDDFIRAVETIDGKINDIYANATSGGLTSLSEVVLSAADQEKVKKLEQEVAELPDRFSNKENWTTSALQLSAAVALSLNSTKPVNLTFHSLAAWADYRLEILHSRAALIAELSHRYSVTPVRNTTSAAGTLSFGSNDLKILAGATGGYIWEGTSPTIGISAGVEVKVPGTQLWIVGNGGLAWEGLGRQPSATGGVNVRTNLSQRS